MFLFTFFIPPHPNLSNNSVHRFHLIVLLISIIFNHTLAYKSSTLRTLHSTLSSSSSSSSSYDDSNSKIRLKRREVKTQALTNPPLSVRSEPRFKLTKRLISNSSTSNLSTSSNPCHCSPKPTRTPSTSKITFNGLQPDNPPTVSSGIEKPNLPPSITSPASDLPPPISSGDDTPPVSSGNEKVKIPSSSILKEPDVSPPISSGDSTPPVSSGNEKPNLPPSTTSPASDVPPVSSSGDATPPVSSGNEKPKIPSSSILPEPADLPPISSGDTTPPPLATIPQSSGQCQGVVPCILMMLCTQDKSQSSDTVGDMSPDTEKTLQKLCAALLPNVAGSHQNKGDVSKSSGLGIELKLGLCAKITQSGESDGVKASDDQIGTSGKFLEGISFQLGISGGMGEDLKLGKISGPVVKSIKSDEGGCAGSEGGQASDSSCSNCQSPCSSPKACGSGGKQSSNGSKGPTSDRKKTSESQTAEKIPPADNTRAFPKDTSSSSGSKKSDKKSLTSPIDLGSLPVPNTEAPITVPLSGNTTSPGGGQHIPSSSDSIGHNTPSGDGKKSNPLKDTGNLPGEPANLTNSGNNTSLDVGQNGTSSSDCTGCKKTKKAMKPEHSKKLEKSSKELNKSTSPMDQLNPSTKDTHDEENNFSTSQNVTVVGNDSIKSNHQIGSNVDEEPLMIMGEDEGIQINPSSEPKNPNPIGISSLVHVSNKTIGSEKKNKIQSKSSNPKNISDHSSQSMITPIPMNPDSSIFLN